MNTLSLNFIQCICSTLYFLINFLNLYHNLFTQLKKVMASSTPSAPINSSRGAADTTAGRIYFSTPSAQVRVPVGDLVSPPPHFCSHYTTGGKTIRGGVKTIRRLKKLSGGGINIRAGAGGPKIRKKNENCPTVLEIAYSVSLYIEPNYTLSSYIDPNYTLSLNIEPNYTRS